MSDRGRRLGLVAACALGLALLALVVTADADARKLPPGFSDHVLFDELKQPTAVAVAPNGTYFVTEKRGTVVSFHGRHDRTPTLVADLSAEVHSFDERGLTGIAIDPGFPKRPYIYLAYTYNAPLGFTAPVWGLHMKGAGEACLGGQPDLAYRRGCPVSSMR